MYYLSIPFIYLLLFIYVHRSVCLLSKQLVVGRGFSRRKDKITVTEMAIESGCRMCDRLPATAEPRDGVRYS